MCTLPGVYLRRTGDIDWPDNIGARIRLQVSFFCKRWKKRKMRSYTSMDSRYATSSRVRGWLNNGFRFLWMHSYTGWQELKLGYEKASRLVIYRPVDG